MSISTSGGNERQPSTVKVDRTTSGGKPKAGGARPAGGPTGAKGPQGKGGGKGRKPVTPVKVSGGRNWGPIAVAGVVVLIALGIVGVGMFYVVKDKTKGTWEQQAAAIKGIVNYRENPDKSITARNHKEGPLTYKLNPPVGGDHNEAWQNCMGDIYDAPIANEHAVHSLEHGAVWITYKMGLPAGEID